MTSTRKDNASITSSFYQSSGLSLQRKTVWCPVLQINGNNTMSTDNSALDNVFADWVLAAFHVNTDVYHKQGTSRGGHPSKPGRKDTIPGELAVDESRQNQDEKTQSQLTCCFLDGGSSSSFSPEGKEKNNHDIRSWSEMGTSTLLLLLLSSLLWLLLLLLLFSNIDSFCVASSYRPQSHSQECLTSVVHDFFCPDSPA